MENSDLEARIKAILLKISIFGGMTGEQVSFLTSFLQCKSYKKGEVVFEQGSSPKNIYTILSGDVKIIERFAKIDYELLHLSEGETFGETELIGIFPRIASAVVEEDCELLLFSRSAFLSLYKENLSLFSLILMNIARETSRRLLISDQKLFELIEKEKFRID